MEKNQAVICDTNILIELFKGKEEVIEICLQIGINNLCISSITIGEFYYGALNKKEIPLIDKHLNRFAIVPVNESISSIFVNLMRRYCLSHKPFIGDMLIAATALYHDMEIYTFNKKGFHFVPNLRLYTIAT